jgi:hypothetical protein
MWPKLSNIEDAIYNNIRFGEKSGMEANNRVAWIRVFSGATLSVGGIKDVTDANGKVTKEEKKKIAEGLIMSSAQVSKVFKAAGETKSGPYAYGGINSNGDIGVSWDGKIISAQSFGSLRPSPLVTGLEIKEGKDQISRECSLKLKCFTLEQMEMIQTYFLEPGYSLCIEYGWNTDYGVLNIIDTKQGTSGILKDAVDRNLDYDKLHKYRVDSKGDYDSFLGFIVGGSVSSDGDKWDISVKLRGAPGLPTFLQGQQKTLELNSTGEVIGKEGEPKPYEVSETEVAGVTYNILRDRRFKNMFNQLPAQRQIDSVRALLDKCNWWDFINFDAAINKNITSYANPGWWARNFGGDNAGKEIKIGTSTIEKEKLFSRNKYISFDLAVKILNSNGQFTAYKMGDKEVSVVFDISKTKIGAFPGMFSTKASKLVIPGWMPDFAVYFLNDGQVSQKKGGILASGKDYGIVNNTIQGTTIQFVQPTALTTDIDNDGLKEKAAFWGYLKNLYINFDVFTEKIQQKNKSIRDVFLDMLNEMSSAVNSFWNFQIVEKQQDGKIIITVIDENWVGQNPNGNVIKKFFHNGKNSVFLDASIDISLPSEMTNQIISRRLALANNPDEPIIRTDGGGFFSSETDLFLQATTSIDGKPRKELSETEKAEQDAKDAAEKKEADKKPSEKIADTIAAKEKKITDLQLEIANINKVNRERNDAIRKIGGTILTDEDHAQRDAIRKQIDDDDQRARDIQYKQIVPLSTEVQTLKSQKTKEEATEKTDAEKNAQSSLSNNLSKIDVLPRVNIAALTDEQVASVTNVANLKVFFAIYCLNDESFFDRMKNDAFNDNKGKGTLSHPLPIKYNFKILGSSGIRRGDTFNIIGIPVKYQTSGLFQVTQIEHQVQGMMWTTDVTGEYRQQQ